MSETVHYRGQIALLEKMPNETLEDQCKRILEENGITELPEYYDSWEETVFEELYGTYVIANDNIYKVLSREAVDPTYNCVAFDDKDGIIGYDVTYYDGGCSFDEAIEDALSYLKGFE